MVMSRVAEVMRMRGWRGTASLPSGNAGGNPGNADGIEESPSKEPKPRASAAASASGPPSAEGLRPSGRASEGCAYPWRRVASGSPGKPLRRGLEVFSPGACFHDAERTPNNGFERCLIRMCVVLADPSMEDRGFPPDVLMEDMIPTLKLVIRAVRIMRFMLNRSAQGDSAAVRREDVIEQYSAGLHLCHVCRDLQDTAVQVGARLEVSPDIQL
ncbi:unnamed protein product [Arctogadus glacialis]